MRLFCRRDVSPYFRYLNYAKLRPSRFLVAGIPLLLLPLMYKKLPESAVYLARRGKTEELFKNLRKVDPNITFDGTEELEHIPVDNSKVPVVGLFNNKRGLSTVMFWTAFFSCLLMVYGLNTWLPKLMIEAGYGLNSSLGFLITLQGGAMVGTIIIARLCDKYGSKKMLVPMYASGAIALTLLGFGGNTFYIYVLVAVVRCCNNWCSKYCTSLCFTVLSAKHPFHCTRNGIRNWAYGRYDGSPSRRVPIINCIAD